MLCVCTYTHSDTNHKQTEKTPENHLAGSKKGEWNSLHVAGISEMKFLQTHKVFLEAPCTTPPRYVPTLSTSRAGFRKNTGWSKR